MTTLAHAIFIIKTALCIIGGMLIIATLFAAFHRAHNPPRRE